MEMPSSRDRWRDDEKWGDSTCHLQVILVPISQPGSFAKRRTSSSTVSICLSSLDLTPILCTYRGHLPKSLKDIFFVAGVIPKRGSATVGVFQVSALSFQPQTPFSLALR